MTPVSPRSARSVLAVAVLSVAVSGALVAGFASSASAFTDPDVSGCLDFKHSRPFFGMKQKLVATNTCAAGPFSFKVRSWSAISSETSDCISIGARQTGGWQWPKGRKNYSITSC